MAKILLKFNVRKAPNILVLHLSSSLNLNNSKQF